MAFPVGKRDYERTHGDSRFEGGWKEQFKETCLQRAKQYRTELFEKRRTQEFTKEQMKVGSKLPGVKSNFPKKGHCWAIMA